MFLSALKLVASRSPSLRILRWTTVWVVACLTIASCQKPATPLADDTLTAILPREPQALDPRFVMDAYGLKLSRLIFASLVTIDPDTLEPVPDLALRVDVLSSIHYRVTLRPHLHFSDGSPLDAEDVVATYRSVVSEDMHSRYASTYRRIARMETPSPHVIDFFLTEPHATFLTDLELPIMRAEDERRRLSAHDPEALIGAGPYRLTHRGSSVLRFEPNPHWHGGTPRIKTLRMLVMRDENTRVLRLMAGKVDLALNVIPPLLVPLVLEERRFALRSAPGIGTTYIGVHMEHAALKDDRVRHAIAHAIDRQALIEAKLGGRARLATGWIPPGHWAHSTDVPQYPFAPEQARQLLDDAGWTADADGVRMRLMLRVSSDRFAQSLARAVASMLWDVGIALDVRPSEVPSLLSDLGRGRFDLVLLEMPELLEPHVLSWFFSSERIPGPARDGANRWRFRDTHFDAVLEQGRSTPDRADRFRAYAEAQRILAEALPVIPLWHMDVVAVVDKRFDEFRAPRDGRFSTLAR